MLQNTHRNSLLFLQAVGIQPNSKKHKDLKITIQALHRQYLHPFKYIEEQASDCMNQVIAKAQISLPWLVQYEDGWPARIYLKRYVDTRRPHLLRTRYAHQRKMGEQKKLQASRDASPQPTKNSEDSTVREFLGSLTPSLEHHVDAFVELGIKDQKTLEAFLSWPQVTQAQFLDEGRAVLLLTSLEKQGLLLGCGLLMQRALRGYSFPTGIW